MVDIGLLVLFIMGFLVGLKRGFILQFIHMTGFIIAFIIAAVYDERIIPTLQLWIPYPSFGSSEVEMLLGNGSFEDAYYRVIAFFLIFILVRIVLQIIGSALDFVTHIPIVRGVNVWAGGVLGFIEVYLLTFIVLYVAALLPIEPIQVGLQSSNVAAWVLEHTPILSNQVKEWWIDNVQ